MQIDQKKNQKWMAERERVRKVATRDFMMQFEELELTEAKRPQFEL